MALPRKKPKLEPARKKPAVKLRLHRPRDPHLESLQMSSRLTEICRRMHHPGTSMVTPEEVIELLNAAKVKFVVMGNYGVGTWRDEPRATQDVDVLVQRSHLGRAIKVFEGAFPHLMVEDFPPVTRFIDPETNKSVLDVMKPVDAIYKAVFKNSIMAGTSHSIPDLEMAIICKFAAMTSPRRADDKKHIDIGDFINIVKTNLPAINLVKLRRLGNKVYPDGGSEIISLVSDIRAGRRISV